MEENEPVQLEFQLLDVRSQRVPNPIRFRIGDLDLLGWGDPPGTVRPRPGPWMRLEIPNFATDGLASLRVAAKHGRALFDLDDYAQVLLFKRDGSAMRVATSTRDITLTADLNHLLEAWVSFHDRAFRSLQAIFPGLKMSDRSWNVDSAQKEIESRLPSRDWDSHFDEYGYLFEG